MKRRLRLALLTAMILGVVPAYAADTASVTVIMPAEIEKGVDPARAIVAMKEIINYVHKQPGLISDELLVAAFDGPPKYIHVMKWQSLSNWTALAASRGFETLLSKDLQYIKISPAQPYRVVK